MMMRCKHCGEPLLGDGYTTVLHCPEAEGWEDCEPDADIRYCAPSHEEIRELLGLWAGGPKSEMARLAEKGTCRMLFWLEKETHRCLAQDEDEALELNKIKSVFNSLEWSDAIDAWVAPWYKPE